MPWLTIPFTLMLLSSGAAMGADFGLYAAGSLKAALTDVAAAYQEQYGTVVAPTFAASGLLRQRIEQGEAPDVFASANMAHPQALAEAGWGGPVALFARNRLCALAQPGLEVGTATLLDVLLDDAVRLGTSTPKSDPSGDYAWELFEKAEALRPGAFATLDAKALQLTGGPDSEKAPESRNTYPWVMEEDRADLFLTYCTNAVLAQQEVPDLQIVALPEELSVGADYGLVVRKDAPPEAWQIALFILSPDGQAILADYGFTGGARPLGPRLLRDGLGQFLLAGHRCVQAGRVYLSPTAPFGWIDRPPSLNRMIGLKWLTGLFYPEQAPQDLPTVTRDFYKLFYHVDLDDQDLDRLLEWAQGRAP